MVRVDITFFNETPWSVEEIVDISSNHGSLTEAQILDHNKLVKEEGFKCFSDRKDMYGCTRLYGLLYGRKQMCSCVAPYGRLAVSLVVP